MTSTERNGMIGKEPALNPVLEFFNNLHADEDRYRWDRIVALHLILLAFINDFGHQFQWSSGQFVDEVSEEIRNPEVKRTLAIWLSKLGLVTPSRELPQRAFIWLLHRLPQTRLVRERHIRRVNKALQK